MTRRHLPDLSGVRVLLVEDHEDTREVIALTLQSCGASVAGADSARAAVEHATSSPVDVLVTDLGLPELDGYWLLGELRRRGMSTPAIALSGYVRELDEARALAAGFAIYLTKPADVDDLCHRIAALLRRG